MSDPDPQERAAEALVRELMQRRLEKAGVVTGRPELYYQCEHDQRRDFEGGSEVRVKVWRPWSNARVDLDTDEGALYGYSVARYSDPPTEAELTTEQAVAAAAKSVEIPPDAELESCQTLRLGRGRHVVRLQWRHVVRGMRVEGDCLRVVLHPDSGRVIEYYCRWRRVVVE